jgi:hypothetical protein
MKTPFDDAIARLVDLAREGYTRGWDNLDRADQHDKIADAICGVHAEWFVLVEDRDAQRAQLAKVRADRDTMIAVHDDVERERDSLRAQLSTLRARCEELEKERDEARMLMRDAREEARAGFKDAADATAITLLDAAFVGPVDVPTYMSAEFARVINAIRINVTMRERATADRDAARAECERVKALADERREQIEYATDETASAITAWLDEWDPSLAEAIALHPDMYTARDSEVADTESICRHLTPSFSNTCLLVMAAIRAGAWRKEQA